MRVPVVVVAGLLSTLVAASPASAQCEAPASVAAYLKAHPGWRILTLADLNHDQQMQWTAERGLHGVRHFQP